MKIEIITSVCDGLGEEPVLMIDGKFIKGFKHYHFDWDVYDHDDTGFQGGECDLTQGQALELHEKLTGVK